MKKLIYSISILLLCSSSLFAQDKPDRWFPAETEATTVIKFSPTRMFRGIVEFGFEQNLGDRVSVDVGFGPTISNVSPFNNGHGIFGDLNGYYNTSGSQIGIHSVVGLRFYPMEDKWVMNGFYVSPTFGFQQFNYQYTDFYNPNGSTANGFRRETSFGFNFGTQNWLSKYFGLDMFMGMGIKGLDIKSFYNAYDPWGNAGAWQEVREKNARWFLTAGVKVSVGLNRKSN